MGAREPLPVARFAFPGPLRERLVAAIVRGDKTTTSSLLLEYERENERLPQAGDRAVVVDSHDRPVAVIETTEVRLLPLEAVDLRFAIDEGEGFASVAEWSAAHVRFWESEEMRAALGIPDFRVRNDTAVVCERFRIVELVAG